jgi:hypothetical protein
MQMALFKKSYTAKEIMTLINQLPEDELDALTDMLVENLDTDNDGDVDTEDKEGETTEQIDKAEEDIAKEGEDTQTEKDRIDESVGEQEELDGDKDSQDAKDRVDEAIGEDNAIEEKDSEENAEEEIKKDNREEAMSAIVARMEALEERVAKIVESLDGDASFGNYSPDVTEGDGDDATEDSRIMQNYMRKQAYRR